jgi:hypothetical protein
MVVALVVVNTASLDDSSEHDAQSKTQWQSYVGEPANQLNSFPTGDAKLRPSLSYQVKEFGQTS